MKEIIRAALSKETSETERTLHRGINKGWEIMAKVSDI